MKVIVVMTDGIHTPQYVLNENYKAQLSGVWRYYDNGTWKYSVNAPEGNNLTYDGDTIKNETYRWLSQSSGANRWANAPEGGASAVELTYQELWGIMSVDYHAYYIRRAVWNGIDSSKASAAYYAWDNEPYTSISAATKNTRLDSICTAAKAQGIIVFAIGFEVTDASATIMENCATSVDHFYRVNGLEITTAFQSIANAIGKLRLTQ